MEKLGEFLPFAFHGGNLLLNIFILRYVLKEYKIRIRIFDRIDKMWYAYCKEHKIPYDALEGYVPHGGNELNE